MNSDFFKFIFLFSLFTKITSGDIPSPQCDGSSLKYSMAINLTNYLNLLSKNNSEVENKTIYQSLDDLEGKKAGLVASSIQMLIALRKGSIRNYTILGSYQEAQIALNNHSIEQFPVIKQIAGESIQMESENLTYIEVTEEEQEEIASVFVMNSNSTNIYNQLKDHVLTLNDSVNVWLGLDEGLKYINKTIENPQENLKVMMIFNQAPFSFYRDGELVGVLPYSMYEFAKKYNYSLEIVESKNNSHYIQAIKDNSVNVSIAYLFKGTFEDDDSLLVIKSPIKPTTVNVIRYDNSINSTTWILPNSIEDFNGWKVGSLTSQKTLLKQLFPKSTEDQIETANNINDLFTYLLLEDIDGILVDKIVLDYYEKRTNRLSSYDDILVNNSYGFKFKDKQLAEKYNEFLANNYDKDKLNNLFNEWKNANTSKKIEEKYTNLTSNNSLTVSFDNVRPMSYLENGIYKGYELDLLYRFAKENDYNIQIIKNISENNNSNTVIIGCQNITDIDGYYFSNPILNSSSILAVRKDSKRDTLPLVALNENYTTKANNAIDIPVEISGVNKTSSCVFPDIFYNDVIIINCSISDLSQNEGFKGEIKHGDSKDRIQILYSTIRADNLIKANELFSDNITIIQSNLSNITCPSNNTDSNDTTTDTNSGNTTDEFKYFGKYKKSSGLSGGAIAGIIIPCALALIAIIVLTFMCSNKVTPQYSENPSNMIFIRNK